MNRNILLQTAKQNNNKIIRGKTNRPQKDIEESRADFYDYKSQIRRKNEDLGKPF